jgi:hypothetical protein
MLDHVRLDGFWAGIDAMAGRVDAPSLRAVRLLEAQASRLSDEKMEHILRLLLDRASFDPAAPLCVKLTPNAPAAPVAACRSAADARDAAVQHFRTAWPNRSATDAAEQVQLRLLLVPEPSFDVWHPVMPPFDDDEPANAFHLRAAGASSIGDVASRPPFPRMPARRASTTLSRPSPARSRVGPPR